MTEEWREVPTIPGYFASSLGRIKGLRGTVLTTPVNRAGYERLGPYVGGRRVNYGVHQMVALAFHGVRPEGAQLVAHNDGNQRNNRPENLRWATYADNAKDRVDHGHNADQRGAANHASKITEEIVREIREEYPRGLLTQAMLGDVYGLTHQAVWSIVNRKNWGHVA